MAQHTGLARDILHGTCTLWRYQPNPWQVPPAWGWPSSAGLGLLWGGCSPSQPLLVVQQILQWNSRSGGDTPVHLQVLLWKAQSCQQQAGAAAGFGWRPCAQTVMDSRRPTGAQGSPQRSFSSWAATGSGPKATSASRRVVGPGGEG